MKRALIGSTLGVLACLAAGPIMADREPTVHALTGARIVQAPGQTIENGTLVIRDGIIEAVGTEAEIPPEARRWDVSGKTLYPGLIESFRTLPWPAQDEDSDAQPSATGHDNVLVTPERRMVDHGHDDDLFAKLRQGGFTAAVLVPRPGLFRGESVMMSLGEGDARSQVILPRVAQNAQLALSSDGGYPGSLMGSIALFRQTMHDARWHRQAQTAFERNPRQRRPEYHGAWAALEATASGEAPIVLESRNPAEALRLAGLAEEFGLSAMLVGSGREYQRLDSLTATGLSWIVPVVYPKAPKVDEEHPERADLAALRHWDQAPANVPRLLEAGAQVALTSHGLTEVKKLHESLERSMEHGLTPEQALASLTTVPAELWGVSDRMGTLEPGKAANVVVADGELFTADVKLTALWIDGRHLELKEIKPPSVDPLGTWDIVIDAGEGGQIPISLKLSGSVEELEGSVTALGATLPVLDASVSDDQVEMTLDSSPVGIPGTITLTFTIEGDSCSGSGTSPSGDFTLSGDRVSGPAGPEVLQ